MGMKTEKKHLYIDDVLTTDDDLHYQYGWKARYTLFSSVFNRLCINHHLADLTAQKNRQISGRLSVRYLSNCSLKFASVHDRHDVCHKAYQPFIPYCIQLFANTKLINKQSKRMQKLITSNQFTDEQRYELLLAIIYYLRSQTPVNNALLANENLARIIVRIINAMDSNTINRFPLLYVMASGGHHEATDLLLAKGADLQVGLLSAIDADDGAIIKFFLDKGASLQHRYDHSRTPLAVAAALGKLNAVRALVDGGANVHKEFDALYFAAINRHSDIATYLISKGAKVNKKPWGHLLWQHTSPSGNQKWQHPNDRHIDTKRCKFIFILWASNTA